ncbi:MAG: thiol-disulfide oxidoreductase DCC family protein [Aureliella sp.]
MPRELELLDPNELPGVPIVIWDGMCNFCRTQVQRLRWFSGPKRLAYLSLHDARVKELCPDLSFEQLMEQLWVVTPSGEKFGGADAGRYLSRRIPRLWWLMPLLHIPFSMPVWRWLYRQIAKSRYRIAGKSCDEGGTCDLH